MADPAHGRWRALLFLSLAELGALGIVVHGGHVLKDDGPEAGFDNWASLHPIRIFNATETGAENGGFVNSWVDTPGTGPSCPRRARRHGVGSSDRRIRSRAR